MIYPITFSIPEEKICVYNPIKTKILSIYKPAQAGVVSYYKFNTEEEYYNEYKESYFALTHKKEGWDCMRHYEILANKCIPYFPDIESCPINTMFLFPKDLIIEGNFLYKTISNKKELDEDDKNKYYELLNKLVDYTKNNLTSSKIAGYILEKTRLTNSKKILYLSGYTIPDYLRCITLHGFKTLYGSNVHDYPKIPHIYKSDSIDYSKLYGRGFTYSNLLDELLHDNELDNVIETKIEEKYFDCIIYGLHHHEMPYFDLINKIYKPNEIILLCGADIHNCDYKMWVNKGYNIFVRELN
jgi:hypothetical protein